MIKLWKEPICNYSTFTFHTYIDRNVTKNTLNAELLIATKLFYFSYIKGSQFFFHLWRLSRKYLSGDVMEVDERRRKYSLDSEQGLQPLNEYDLWVLPTIPRALILPLQKNLQCLMIPGTLGWAPTLINEPHLRGASIPGDTMVMSSR